MTWETRTRGGVYYTRTRRVAGRRVREYVGAAGSPTAELSAAEDLMRREHREREQAVRRTEQEQNAEAERPLEALAAIGDALLATALVASGYHQHDRGAWRKKRRA